MAMTHSHVCYISATGGHERVNLIQKKIWVRGLSFIWEISKSYVCHDALVSVTWFIHMCAMTHSHVCHLSATGGHERVDLIQKERWRRVVPRHTWFIFNTIPQRFRCVPWLPHMCDTYHFEKEGWQGVVPRHIWCHTCEWVMAHMWISHGTYVNESWHMYEWVMAHNCHTCDTWSHTHTWHDGDCAQCCNLPAGGMLQRIYTATTHMCTMHESRHTHEQKPGHTYIEYNVAIHFRKRAIDI